MEPDTISSVSEIPSESDLLYIRLKKITQNLFRNLSEEVLAKLLNKFRIVELLRGDTLCNEGDQGNSCYILVTGRLQAIIHANTPNERVVGQISQGEIVGEMALITGDPRSATILALRDSTLVKLSKPDFDELVAKHPEVLLNISRLTINRLNYTMHHAKEPARITNIALLPTHTSKSIDMLVQRLIWELNQTHKVKHLHRGLLAKVALGSASHAMHNLQSWLSEQELDQEYVVYEADDTDSEWTQQCLRQADKIIIIKEVSEGETLSPVEEMIFQMQPQQQNIEIVLLYPENTTLPNQTHRFLALRPVKRHYNIRANSGKHVARLSRMIIDKGVGLVLGGGGAKGFAHIGIYKALAESNIPIDMVCGTSIGAIVAATIAHEWTPETIIEKARTAFLKDKPLNDYTLPITSLIKGHKLQKVLRKNFGDLYIEDLWLNFFCISSNFTLSEMMVHQTGPLWKATAASISIPGVMPPVVDGNNLLVDGASFNNFPVDVMKANYGGRLIGINLLKDKEYKLNYTNFPSGWYMFFSKFIPFVKRYKSPSISTIMLKSNILSSMEHQRQQVHNLEVFMAPPVARYSLLDMQNYDRIVGTGYTYGKEYLQQHNLNPILVQ